MSDSISGKNFRIIEAALPEILKHKISIENYRIVVLESKSSFIVSFEDPDRPQGQRGSTPDMLGYEVELSKDRLQVIRSNFVR